MDLLLISQSIVVPMLLSTGLAELYSNKKILVVSGFMFIWMFSFIWITGLPEIIPSEAIGWILLMVIALSLSIFIKTRKIRLIVYTLITIASFTAYLYPVLVYEVSIQLLSELILFGLVTVGLFFLQEYRKPRLPSLVMSICSGFLAIGALLGGSILIAQLSSVLAFTLSGFAIHDIRCLKQTQKIGYEYMILSIGIYYSLMMIGYIFSDFPFLMTLLLLFAPLPRFLISGVSGWVGSISLLLAAVISIYDKATISSY